jgi:ABC-type nitrate/sulfonate/bicarbonate transport system substrate-binding protein
MEKSQEEKMMNSLNDRRQNRRDVLKTVAGAGVAAALSISGVTRARAQAKLDKVVFSTGLSAPYTPYVALVEKGFAAKHGFKAEYRIFEAGPKAIEALVTGNAHVSAASEMTTFRPRASGAKILGVGRSLISGKDIGIGVGPNITKPEDFKGKKFGMIPGGTGHYLFDKFIQKHGLREGTGPDELQIVSVQPPEWIPAVQRGDIDGFFGWEPWLTKLPTIVRGGRLYAYSGEDDLYTMWYTLVCGEDWMRADPELAGAVYNALADTMAWINANNEEAVQLASRAFRVPLADMRTQMAGSTFLLDTKKEHPVRIKEIANWVKSKGYLKSDNIEQSVDAFYYPDIAKKYASSMTDF